MARKARTNAIVEGPVADPPEAGFPVLLYHHGGAWIRWGATFVAEWLASHGYVVFSIEHFGFNQTVRYPGGTRFEADTLAFPETTEEAREDVREPMAMTRTFDSVARRRGGAGAVALILGGGCLSPAGRPTAPRGSSRWLAGSGSSPR